KARGMMARYLIDQQIDNPEAIMEFNCDGYAYNPAMSIPMEWVFTRRQ
ncbi:MAG: peroxide stress protein YaaA, partial [Gammaproteobacteria bacterium]|nr:peroxide stress protein YaaA [Gammaproteobacteria bacterium]